MSYFWSQLRPAAIDLTNDLKATRQMILAGKLNYATISLPVFSISGIPWLGASFIAIEFPLDLGVNVNLLTPITKPANVNFCLAVRWGSGANVYRRKLWADVGEVLDYPLYNGEAISHPLTLEAWTTFGHNTVSIATAFSLQTGRIAVRETCVKSCEELAQDDEAEVNDYLFTGYFGYYTSVPLPLTFTETLIQVIARQT